jgi:hypothetical protein
MSIKKHAPLTLLLALPLSALASPSKPLPPAGSMDGMQLSQARAAGAQLEVRQCAFAPDKEGMKTGASGPMRVMLVDESGELRFLGVLEKPMKPAAEKIHFSSDPVKGGT